MDVDVADGVTIVRLDHPPVNAFDLALVEDAVDTFRRVEGPVVITGAGSCFSAGVDLRAVVDGAAAYADRFLAAVSAAFLGVFDHPAPVVAAINGHAIAGGCVLAMAADVRLMSRGKIGLSELAVGVPFPVAALEICRYAMGASATRAVLQAENIDARSALARGWIDEVVDPQDLVAEAVSVASRLGHHAPGPYALTKQQLHRPTRDAIESNAHIDEQVLAGWKSGETRDRIAAFLDALK
jgi:enoyl-CoA hydratase